MDTTLMSNPGNSNITISLGCSAHAALLSAFCISTFQETYGPFNKTENMNVYIRNHFSTCSIEQELKDDKNTFFLIFNQQILIGYMKLRPATHELIKERPSLELQRLYISKAFQGHAIGSLLMQQLFNRAFQYGYLSIWLDVWQENKRAIRFYQKWHFSIIGEVTFNLGDDCQQDYIMSCNLSSLPGLSTFL